MLTASLTALVLMAVLTTIQTVVALRYLALFHPPSPQHPTRAELPDADSELKTEWPLAAVVLAVRGSDPKLVETLRRLTHLDYPNYQIHVVVDSENDPALELVKNAARDAPDALIEWSFLEEPSKKCSLKCASLIQACREVDPKYEVLAFIDGDALPEARWLKSLVAPLQDSSIGVCTGNRWYVCHQGAWGTLVRYYWNAAAIVQVWFNGIVWAGSMSMRRDFIEDSGLLDEWGRSLSVDGSITRRLQGRQERVQFVPSVMVAIEEETGLPRFVSWVRRQMVAALTSSEGWLSIVSHGYLLAALQVLPIVLVFLGIYFGSFPVILSSTLSLTIYWGSGFWLANKLERTIAPRLQKQWQADSTPTLRIPTTRRFLSMLLTNLVYPYVLTTALFSREVQWRGIRYRLSKGGGVEMLDYSPYQSPSDQQHEGAESVV